jgi:hypothetical protein
MIQEICTRSRLLGELRKLSTLEYETLLTTECVRLFAGALK